MDSLIVINIILIDKLRLTADLLQEHIFLIVYFNGIAYLISDDHAGNITRRLAGEIFITQISFLLL